jgi:hypothetical protein
MTQRSSACSGDFFVSHGSSSRLTASPADPRGYIIGTRQEHLRLGVTPVLKEVRELRMHRRPTYRQEFIQLNHFLGNNLTISRCNSDEKGVKGALDLEFHGGWSEYLSALSAR